MSSEVATLNELGLVRHLQLALCKRNYLFLYLNFQL